MYFVLSFPVDNHQTYSTRARPPASSSSVAMVMPRVLRFFSCIVLRFFRDDAPLDSWASRSSYSFFICYSFRFCASSVLRANSLLSFSFIFLRNLILLALLRFLVYSLLITTRLCSGLKLRVFLRTPRTHISSFLLVLCTIEYFLGYGEALLEGVVLRFTVAGER